MAKRSKFLPPTRAPINSNGMNMAVMKQQINKTLDAARLEASNDTLNLIYSIVMIVLHEYHNFTSDQLQELLEKSFEQMELVGEELVTIDQMMELCQSYGVDIQRDVDVMDKLGDYMQAKIKVFKCLDDGITEIEEIHKKTGVESRMISGFRWLYNRQKWEDDTDMATKTEIAYKMLDAGATVKDLVSNMSISIASAYQYKSQWGKSKKTVDDLADELFGEEETEENKVEVVEEVHHEIEEGEVVVGEQEKVVPVVEEPKKTGLRKVVKFESDLAEYQVKDYGNGDGVDVTIDGQVLTLGKAEVEQLVAELGEVLGEMR